MGKRILTLDNLYQFFVQQGKSVNFSSKDAGAPIVVTSNGLFATEQNADMPGMLKLKLKNCHIQLNRNGSFISQENMEKAMPTLKYRPILAYIHELPDGTKDFYAHNMEFVEDENGDEQVVYIEKQVGCFTADDPWLEYDKENDKTYVMAYAVIPEEYTEAADIIRRKNGTKVSTELVINELAYNAKEKYLDLIDFYFGGTTLLGSDEDGNEIGEGMLGARADITDFCHKEPVFTYQDKLIEVLDKLNMTLSNFNIKQSDEEGGVEKMDNFENELEEEVVETEAEDGVVETNEAEETEVVEETNTEETSTSEDGDSESAVTEEEACGGKKKKKKCSIDENGNMSISFEISHEDIRGALYNLIGLYEEEDNEWYWIANVYDEYFIFENWDGNKLYKQSYSIDGDNVALSGDRQEMFKMILTESEKLAIEKMRQDYSDLEAKYNELKTFKDQYDASQVKTKKDEIFAREEYVEIANTDEFKALIADMDKYSVEDIEVKCDLIFASHEKAKYKKFAAENQDKKPTAMRFSVSTVDETNKKPYGNLFE